MSVEGMWAIYFGDVADHGATPNSGVIILESGRVFGGDSLIAYLGVYEVQSGRIHGSARTWTYNPALAPTTVSAFGRTGPMDVQISLEGDFNSDAARVDGVIYEAGNPRAKLPVVMLRISDLP